MSEDNYKLMIDTPARGESPSPPTRVHHIPGAGLAKKGLVSLNELNEKFMRSNAYIVGFIVFLYLVFGISMYHHWLGWNLLQSLYFVTITTISVGYGDFVPITKSERLFTSFFIIIGIAMCGSLVGVISTFIFDHQARMAKQRNLRSFLHMKEKKRLEATNPMTTADVPSVRDSEVSPTGDLESSGDRTSSVSSVSSAGEGGKRRRKSILQIAASTFRPMEEVAKSMEEIREDSISGYMEDLTKMRIQSVRDFVLVFMMLIFGMVAMIIIESWNSADSFYWATCTLTTVGYGDIVPKTRAGRIFTIFYVLIGCVFLAKALTDFVKYPLLSSQLKHEIEIINQFAGELSPEKLESIFQNEFYKLIPDLKRSENEMTKCEFVLMVLQLMNKVEEKDIFLAAKIFENLDSDKKGFLSNEDMSQQVNAAVTRTRNRANTIRQEGGSNGGSPQGNTPRVLKRSSGSSASELWSRITNLTPTATTARTHRPHFADSPVGGQPQGSSSAPPTVSAPPQRRNVKAKSTNNIGISLTSKLFPQDEDHYNEL